MKNNIKKATLSLMMVSMTMLFLSSCVEHRYYQRYHHHTRPYYERHHMPPPAGVNFELDVRN